MSSLPTGVLDSMSASASHPDSEHDGKKAFPAGLGVSCPKELRWGTGRSLAGGKWWWWKPGKADSMEIFIL